jgi:hypothetical protein
MRSDTLKDTLKDTLLQTKQRLKPVPIQKQKEQKIQKQELTLHELLIQELKRFQPKDKTFEQEELDWLE